MAKPMQIDFVSDVVCPWCVIGLRELERALARLTDVIAPNVHLQPFELNPTMPEGGQNMAEHIMQKFGRSMDQSGGVRDALRARAEAVGFTMTMDDNSRIYNSFDAHRLLYWAELAGRHIALKHALFAAYFTQSLNIADQDILVGLAEAVGLDPIEARAVLSSGRYRDEVLDAEQRWLRSGINSVPSVVIDRKYLISGGQTAAVFEQTLRQIAAAG